MPVGTSWELAGLVRQQSESFRSLLLVLAAGVLLVSGVLLFQLRSVPAALSVLVAAPVAAAGAIFTLVITRVSLNVSSAMGIILLVGLVVKNGILLLDQALALEARGTDHTLALREAGRTRLRPIL